MRICYITGATFTHIVPYLEYFKSAGHDVHCISLTPGPERCVPTYNLGLGGKYSGTKGKWKYLASMIRARSLVKKLKPDIVHTHYVTSGGLTGLICGFHPTITTAHGTDLFLGVKSLIWKLLLKEIFKHADCVNTVSEDLKEKAISIGADPEKVYVLTLGVDTDKILFQPKERNSDEALKLVTTRSLEPVYSHSTTIKALSIVRAKGVDIRMTFVAGGSLLQELKQTVEEKGLTNKITFLNGVDKENIPSILHKNDVYLSSSLWDGTSISLLETMAAGVFPIVSDIKANSDWLEHGVDGFLYRTGDPESLANCILQFYKNPKLVSSALQRNRKKVIESGDTITNMKILEKIYEELVKKWR